MNKVLAKLKSRRGESLIESLVAIMAFAISSVVMYSMITAAADINITARRSDEDYQNQQIMVEQAQGSGRSASISMTLTQGANGTMNQYMGKVNVAVYGGDDGELFSYYVIPKGDG